MIQGTGVCKHTDLSRLKRMEFVISRQDKADDGYYVTVVRTVNPWDGILHHLKEEFPGMTWEQKDNGGN